MSIITPTVGRVVWYWPTEQDRKDIAIYGDDKPLAAVIAYVHSDSMVNLSVFDHAGVAWSRTSVHLAQAGESVPVSRYAEWPKRDQGDSFKRLPFNIDLIQAINTLGWTAKELSNTVGDDARRVSRKILARLEQLLDADQPTTAVAPEHGAVIASDSSREAEQRALEAGFTAPSVTQDQINALLDRITYRYEQPEGTTATFAHAFLDGEFYLATGFSACVSPENFNKATGEKYAGRQALEKATGKLWELEGYALRKSLREPRCSGSVNCGSAPNIVGHTLEAR